MKHRGDGRELEPNVLIKRLDSGRAVRDHNDVVTTDRDDPTPAAVQWDVGEAVDAIIGPDPEDKRKRKHADGLRQEICRKGRQACVLKDSLVPFGLAMHDGTTRIRLVNQIIRDVYDLCMPSAWTVITNCDVWLS